MRVINARRLIEAQEVAFAELGDGDYRRYAILSHCWGEQEVSFQDMQYIESHRREMQGPSSFANSKAAEIKQRDGYAKILHTCRQALQNQLDFVWIDTCCIDKSSSAELQEAINSMFLWYANAAVCYVYLVDLSSDCPYLTDDGPNLGPWLQSFQNSRWFTRGWTLQELLAPEELYFYSSSWARVGNLHGLVCSISTVTKIDTGVLLHSTPLFQNSVATRMSWAANRQTTRIEDRAYSLLGIFDINMPMLYGEKEKAFTRLQEEIMKKSDDLSILAWDLRVDVDREWLTKSSWILAGSPDDFQGSRINVTSIGNTDSSFEMTNAGLRLDTHLLPLQNNPGMFAAFLNCHMDPSIGWMALCVKKASESSNRYIIGCNTRPDSDYLVHGHEDTFRIVHLEIGAKARATRKSIIITRDGATPLFNPGFETPYTCEIHWDLTLHLKIIEAWPPNIWNVKNGSCRSIDGSFVGAIMLQLDGIASVTLVMDGRRRCDFLAWPSVYNDPGYRVGFVNERSAKMAYQKCKLDPSEPLAATHSLGGRSIEVRYVMLDERYHGRIWIEKQMPLPYSAAPPTPLNPGRIHQVVKQIDNLAM